MAKSKALAFDRMALEAALREHPGDRGAASAFVDWLCEFETTPFNARRVAVGVIRDAIEEREVKAAQVVLDRPGSFSSYIKWRIYWTLGQKRDCKWPILIVKGSSRPTIRARHREPGEIHELVMTTWVAPSGDRRWEYSVEVGVKWMFREQAYRDEIARRIV